MAGKNLSKRKSGHGTVQRPNMKHKSKTLTNGQRPSTHSRRGRGRGRDGRPPGRSLPAGLRNPSDNFGSDDDKESYEGNDLYEYEEGVAEEETRRNRRYDPVDNFEYQLPKEIEDENVRSDDEEDNEFGAGGVKSKGSGNDEDDDRERHLRMLQGITGMPSEAFEGNKKKRNAVVSEPYQESEYNPSRDVLDGEGHVTIDDLVESLHGTSEYSKLRKRTMQVDKKSFTLLAPLPKEDRARLDRTVAYKNSKREVTKWDPLVKRNKEAPTIIFDRDIDVGFSTVGAIASQFEPRTEFEKKMAVLVSDDKVMAAHKEDGARLLELNKISIEDYKKQRDHIAKMRSLLFRHEIKMKRVKKIKSKTYRRLAEKDRSKMGSSDLLLDPEAAREQAMKKERDRAEARMNLRHKNHSKWARRILERGLNVQDDDTRAALAEQLNEHARLTRKINSLGDTSSSDGGSDEDNDGDSAGSDQDETSKVLTKGKERTLQLLEEDNNAANSGLLSLPFMVRGQKKREEAAREEAMLALLEYEESLKQFDETNGAENDQSGVVKGRRVFGGPVKHVAEQKKAIKNGSDHSDSDDQPEIEAESDGDIGPFKTNGLQKDTTCKDLDSHQDSVFKSFDDIVSDPGPKTTFDVSIFASGTWKKMNGQRETDKTVEASAKRVANVKGNKELEEVEGLSDTDSEGELVDGNMSSGPEATYKLPSQEELVREAFAGDDVEEEFFKDKEEILNEENPEPEKPVLLPGWGQWTHIQKKKGTPSWMLEVHDRAKRKRDEALQNRKDARLKHVIISEKLDKKAEKLHTKTLPYPFTSKEVFEQSIRMPIGPEFNPATAVGALNRPEVKKRSGVIIKPVHFEEVDPYEKSEDKKRTSQKQKPRKNGGRIRLKPVIAKS